MPDAFKLCPHWPKCKCIVQGYVNGREPNNCGRKPSRPQRAADLSRDPRPAFVRILDE